MESYEFNGLDALTGRPLLRLTHDELGQLAQGERIEPKYFDELKSWHEQCKSKPFDVIHGVDICRLEETGWGVVWPHGVDPAIKKALAPLLDLRKEQAGERYHELTRRPKESTLDFLARHGVGPSPVDPRKLPYYLLLVGSPEQIPFLLQYRLDVQYGVGRLDFDEIEAFERYAEGVVAAEKGEVRRERRASFFGVANTGDDATLRSRRDLVEPLAEEVGVGRDEWTIETLMGQDADKAAFTERFGGALTPALAFVGCHGLGYSEPKKIQLERQGALVCQDWPGPRWRKPLTDDHYFAAADVADDADPSGLVAFLFACYGAGTPQWEDHFQSAGERRQLAERSFTARLPQRLLGHPKGSALAVIGHVERAWTYSFDWPQAGPQLQVFENGLGRLLDGYPVGAAMDQFGQRFAELSIYVRSARDDLMYDDEPDLLGIAARTLAFKDARSYVVLGDPAVRLAVDSPWSKETES